MKLLWGLLGSLLWAQEWVGGIIADEDGDALPFVTVRNLRTQEGTYTDLQGRFRIKAYPKDTLELRCVGYEARRISVFTLPETLKLRAQPIELQSVIIRPGENPAYRLIRLLQMNADRWDPLRRPHKYLSYNKLTLSLPDSLQTDTIPPYLLIWETETEKIYYNLSRYKESLLAQSVSGNLPIQSPFSPTSFLPISLYSKRITLLENDIASPIGSEAFEYYEYAISDTFYAGGDTLIQIEFFPRKGRAAWAMYGKLTIALPDGALYALQAETDKIRERSGVFQTPFYRIWHYYEKLGDTLWFPTQLHSEVLLRMRSRQNTPISFLLRSRSFLRSIQLIADTSEIRRAEVVLPDRLPAIRYRAEELTLDEQRSYRLMDSLFSKVKVRRLAWLLDIPTLMTGRIPMGVFNLILRPLVLYHDAEGLRPQIGLETNDSVSRTIRLRLWAGYGLYRWAVAQGSPWRYGAELLFGRLNQAKIFYYDDIRENTLPRLVDENAGRFPDEQSVYEATIRGYSFRWEDMVRERAMGMYMRLFLVNNLTGYASVAGMQRDLFAERWRGMKASAGVEYIHRQTVLRRGGIAWRSEYALPRLHIQGGLVWQEGRSYLRLPFWTQIDFAHSWRWGRWAEIFFRFSTIYSQNLPNLWRPRLRTLPDLYAGIENALAAHPVRHFASVSHYLFFEWSIPNTRFPSSQWTPTMTLHLQGAYADDILYPEGGLSIQKWVPPFVERVFPSLRLLRLGVFVPLRDSLLRERFYVRLMMGHL
ncbi:MAG: DUF5686 and carboxypeptidase regulatory-like domain-containing protein [Bacteroidia bacterium]|nr:DUF5686 and carboxypeptidase regulatory-like domain-containing protein [Bacteroidia bacterium]MDW8417320.1 DUF5686 family protein [Bacteroidia bacterium]